MVSGAADTPAGSVTGFNVVPSSPACHPYWTGSKIGGLTERLIAILSLDDERDSRVEQRQHVLEVMPSISEQM